MGLPLRRAFAGMIPFALVAFVQFYRSLALLGADRKAVPAWLPKLARSGPAPWGGDALEDASPTNSRAVPPVGRGSAAINSQLRPPRATADSTPPLSAPTAATAAAPAAAATTSTTATAAAAATASDQAAQSAQAGAAETPALRGVTRAETWAERARDADRSSCTTLTLTLTLALTLTLTLILTRPPPTLSTKRLLDGGPNWLPVPNAEGTAPDDLAWQQLLVPNSTRCPPGRRPYHTILTAQRSLYQERQTLPLPLPLPLTLTLTPTLTLPGVADENLLLPLPQGAGQP